MAAHQGLDYRSSLFQWSATRFLMHFADFYVTALTPIYQTHGHMELWKIELASILTVREGPAR